MPGRRQKHPSTLVDARASRSHPLRAVTVTDRPMPPVPEGLHPKAEQLWVVLWSSSLAGAFKETDVDGLERLFWYKSEWFRATEISSDRRYVIKVEKVIRELEKAYGLDPLSRLRLGLTLVDEAKAVQGLKAPVKPREMT